MDITRDQALELVHKWTKNLNLVRHMLAVEAQMRALATHFGKDEDKWGLAGLIHDADYEKWPDEHPKKTLAWLEENHAQDWLIQAVETHAWRYNSMIKEPSTPLDWALYTCDELAGFIIAVALTRPDKKLSSVSLDSILKKWNQKAFAKGVDRQQIELCQEKLEISLGDYISVCLKALQGIADELGL